MSRRRAAAFAAIALISGCATVRTPVPPAAYRILPPSDTYTITSSDGEVHEANDIKTTDSTLVIVRPRYTPYDRHRYPVTLRYDEIESIETSEHVSLLYLEAGAVAGKNFGAASPDYSRWRATFDVGYLTGEREPVDAPRWDYGGTLFLGISDRDTRVGLKGHALHRFNRTVALDVNAGPLFNWWDGNTFNGFVGGVGVDLGPYFSLQSEYTTFKVEPWSEGSGGDTIHHPGGYEQVWYNGAALHGRPAWVTVGLGVAAFVVLTAIFIATY
ncbi:MAG TPA: hypothetical protein VF247_12670 [Candidatus Krumholzibacteria bacterium]